MSDYTPEEVRLLDLCAASWVGGLAADSNMKGHASAFASQAYDLAAAMIAERRKRVPYTTVTEVPPQGNAQSLYTAPVAQPKPVVQRGGPVPHAALDRITEEQITEGLRAVAEGRTVSVSELRKECAQPEPEKGELTEESVRDWEEASKGRLARSDAEGGGDFYCYGRFIDRAVALMRKGLAAKEELVKTTALQAAINESAEHFRARAEKAEAALAEAQPVLDAVVGAFDEHHAEWSTKPNRALQAYADRRREQAKGAS